MKRVRVRLEVHVSQEIYERCPPIKAAAQCCLNAAASIRGNMVLCIAFALSSMYMYMYITGVFVIT